MAIYPDYMTEGGGTTIITQTGGGGGGTSVPYTRKPPMVKVMNIDIDGKQNNSPKIKVKNIKNGEQGVLFEDEKS